MKTQSSSIRRPGLTPKLMQHGRAAALHLAVAAATLAALPALAIPTETTLDFYGHLGNLAAEADITFQDNGQLLITLMNTGAVATSSLDELLAGVIFTLPGKAAQTPKLKTEDLAGELLGKSKSLSTSWTTSLAPQDKHNSSSDMLISLEGDNRTGIVSKPTSNAAGITGNNNAEYSLARGNVDFTFTFADGSITPDEFRGATVEFLFGGSSKQPKTTVAGVLGDSGLPIVPPAPAAPAAPLPEPTPVSLIGLALTVLLVARKRF